MCKTLQIYELIIFTAEKITEFNIRPKLKNAIADYEGRWRTDYGKFYYPLIVSLMGVLYPESDIFIKDLTVNGYSVVLAKILDPLLLELLLVGEAYGAAHIHGFFGLVDDFGIVGAE